MGLINLQTNLKSLRFGNDRVHGGSSKQPYIQTPIPENSGGFGVLDTDFILRGGSRAVTDSIKDVERLGKYFLDIRNPSGLLFVAKQNLLSRTAVRTQASGFLLNDGIYTPLSTLAEAGGVAFGLHVNKQGLNPFSGLLSAGTFTPNQYADDVQREIRSNRLTVLYTHKIVNSEVLPRNLNGIKINSGGVNILNYSGGPGSTLGIGNTNIRFADQRTTWGTDKKLDSQVTQNGTLVLTPSQIAEASDINKTRSTSTFAPQTQDFRKFLRQKYFAKSTVLSNSPDYDSSSPGESKTLEYRTNLGRPGDISQKNTISYTNGYDSTEKSLGAASPNSYDKINALPIYRSETVDSTNKPTNDLIQFNIGVINNDKPTQKDYIHFRAFLNGITDGYTAEWKGSKYIGRGEDFYTYGGFDRKVSLSWTVAAQSKAELMVMYKKLNFLSSICMPDYNDAGYMRGNVVTLTVGDYFHEQPGIITGFSYEMNDDNATWEIGIDDSGEIDESVRVLPHLIKVSGFNFIPIHNFVPRKQNNTFDGNGNITEYGKQAFISLQNNNVELDPYNENITNENQLYNPTGLPQPPAPGPPILGNPQVPGIDINTIA